MSSHMSEEKIFTENYAKLCNTLTDINNLLKYFVQAEIITDEQGLEISSNIIPSEKVKKLLIHISGPLKAGNKANFYTMLEIMEKQGTCTTKELAAVLKTALKGSHVHQTLTVDTESAAQQSAIYEATRLSAQFSSFVRAVENILDENTKNFEVSKRFCLDLKIGDNSDILLFNDEQFVKINACSNFRQLFELLRPHWTWKHYFILEHIISHSESKPAKDELEKYEKLMSSYFGLQLVSDKYSPDELPDDYIQMSIIVDKPYKEFTLKDFIDLRNFIFKHMDIKPYVARPFIKFLFSSLCLEWYILRKAAPHMTKMIDKNFKKYVDNFIVYIKIDQTVVMDKLSIATKATHGYLYSFVNTPPADLICNICELPCRNSHISVCCKNLCCQSHISKIKDEKDVNICLMCKKEKFSSNPDLQSDKMIEELLVYCPNTNAGCTWIGKLHEVSEHCNNDTGCQHQVVPCTYTCGRLLQRCNLDEHLQTDCPSYCQYCKATIDKELVLNKHKENCVKFPVPCPNQCGSDIPRDCINEHKKQCPLEKIQCEYHEVGCKTIMSRREVQNHNVNEITTHLNLIKNLAVAKTNKKGSSGLYCYLFLLFIFCIILLLGVANLENLVKDLRNDHNTLEEKWSEGRKSDLLLAQEKISQIKQKVNTQAFLYEIDKKNLVGELWSIRMLIECMVSLEGNQIAPIIIRIYGFDTWKIQEKTWKSAPFYDVEGGNRYFVSADPSISNIIISLHTIPPIINKNLKGTFKIEVLNQLNDTDHLVAGSLKINNKSTSVVKKHPNVYLLGEVKYNEIEKTSLIEKNIIYLLDNTLYFKISYNVSQ